jgi:hypothetical protein
MDNKQTQNSEAAQKPDDGSVNEIAVKVAHRLEPKIEGVEVKHLGRMQNDGQVKRRI